MNEVIRLIAGSAVLGVLLLGAGVVLLREYRRSFLRDCRSVMSAEVLLHLLKYGSGPGYLALAAIAAGVWFVGTAIYIAIGVVVY